MKQDSTALKQLSGQMNIHCIQETEMPRHLLLKTQADEDLHRFASSAAIAMGTSSPWPPWHLRYNQLTAQR